LFIASASGGLHPRLPTGALLLDPTEDFLSTYFPGSVLFNSSCEPQPL